MEFGCKPILQSHKPNPIPTAYWKSEKAEWTPQSIIRIPKPANRSPPPKSTHPTNPIIPVTAASHSRGGSKKAMLTAPVHHLSPRLQSSPFPHHSPRTASPSLLKSATNGHRPGYYPCIRALEFDQNTVVAVSVGLVSVAVGIGIPAFYESQIERAAKRENRQSCFPCNGSGAQKCRFCTGTGSVIVELGGDEREVSSCINCDGAGSLTCTTCQGTGIQPRYLDRREFKDDD